MMIVGIISDTHGNIKYLNDVTNFLVKNYQIDKIYHLGDNYSDGDALKNLNIEHIIVPGIYDPEYELDDIPNIVIDKVDGFQILLVHTIDDVDMSKKKYSKCKIICYGHTHNWKVELIDGILYLNPGHLKAKFHKGRIASFAILSINNFFLNIKIFDIEKKLLKEDKFLFI